MSSGWPFTVEKIAARLELIAPYVHRKRLPLPSFRMLPLPAAIVDAPICADPTHWRAIAPQSYWGHADLNFVMKSTITVPEGWDAEHIALHLPLGVLGDIFNHPEALVHVDRAPIGSADRYHHTLPLSADLADGKAHVLSLHGWTGLAGWPPDPSCKAKLFMGTPALVERDPTLLAFVQLAQSALDTARILEAASPEHLAIVAGLDAALKTLDTRAPIGEALYETASAALAELEQALASAGGPLDVTLHGIGHAHMDIAYLWPIDQIRLKNARTYSNVLRLMDEDPDYRFSHSQPQLYAYTAQDYPDLFAQIKERVAEGRWEVMGGMWVEPDLNIPGPEALIRQLTLGRGYFKDTFGDVATPVLWLPDTFGFPAQIPQLMKLAGLKWFATNKLNWNQLNAVPSSTHHWEGLDGSQVLAQVLTTPRDVQYLPFPTNYKSDLSAAEVLGTWTRSTAPETVRDLPICYGYGDGGGGPTEDLLTKARAFEAMPGMPRFKHSTIRALFEAIEGTPDLPVWRGEHYMEGHRGTYTSQGWIKLANRKAEWALHEAEAMAAMAGQAPDLVEAWQLLCLNQFHDILTGTSIGEVFEDARRDFARIRQIAEAAAQDAASALTVQGGCVVNTSPVSGSRLALIDAPHAAGQSVGEGTLVYFDDLPSYSVTPIADASAPAGHVSCTEEDGHYILENAFLTVTVNAFGQLETVFDKTTGQQVLAPGALGNELLAFEDRPICWDAWDIDPSYEDRCETVRGDTGVACVETGPLRASIQVTTKWRSSEIRQRIHLSAHSRRIDFVTDIDWHESHTLLKAAFPTALQPQTAQYDIQWGRISRSAQRDTDFDAARFEVPAQKWVSIEDETRAVAVLNDCKYGYDVLDGTVRITLIKSATSPDPDADQGRHHFTYALLPYDPKDRAVLDREAYDLNVPLRVQNADGACDSEATAFVRSQQENVIVETVKPANDGNGVILRIFEAWGVETVAQLRFVRELETAELVSIFEGQIEPIGSLGNHVEVAFGPFEIKTIRVTF